MIEFLNLFMDVFLYPMSPEVNSLAENPLAAGMVCILIGIGFPSLLLRILLNLLPEELRPWFT